MSLIYREHNDPCFGFATLFRTMDAASEQKSSARNGIIDRVHVPKSVAEGGNWNHQFEDMDDLTASTSESLYNELISSP